MSSTAIGHPPAVGDLAPDFTADSTSGERVTLSSFRGTRRVLLAFFPLAFTSVCTIEMCEFTADFDQFVERGVEVLPISVDSVPTLKEFRAKNNLRPEILSDFTREISRTYGTLLPDRFFSNRAYFLIDTDGRIVWKHIEASPVDKRTSREILDHIR